MFVRDRPPSVPSCGLSRQTVQASQRMYAAPRQSMAGLMAGMNSYSSEENTAQHATMADTPINTPTLNGSAPLKPYLPAFVMAMMLFGPGVNAIRET